MVSAVGCIPMHEHTPFLSVAALRAAYRSGELSPVEVTQQKLARIQELDPAVHAVSCPLNSLALEQAKAAEEAYRQGTPGPLAGIPISIKDTFDIQGKVTNYGSLAYDAHLSTADSGCVRRLRSAGAVFVAKTHTAEFGQSATSENRLGPVVGNPWNLTCTTGGSSGGAAASVASGMATVALGADGGGSIRIPAAFTGLVGVKPSQGRCPNEGGFRAMSPFVCPGPLAWRVADAREMLTVLADRMWSRQPVGRSLRVAWCAKPERRPVDSALLQLVSAAVQSLADLGHSVDAVDLPLHGWNEAFGPLVLDEERRERGHLLTTARHLLTDYVRRSLEGASRIDATLVKQARLHHAAYQAQIADLFQHHDVIVTPATAVPAFPLGKRPKVINGQQVDWLWGAFPFTSPFNVAGVPAVTLPCGFVNGMPVGVQLVFASGQDEVMLNLAEDLEEALALDMSKVMASRVLETTT